MKKKLLKLFSLVGAGSLAVPLMALAQQTGGTPTTCATIGAANASIQGFICKLNEILGALLPFLIALGVIYFVWGVISYVIADEEEAKKKGRDRMIYGIIGLVVIISVWGLVRLIQRSFGLSQQQDIQFPTVPY